RRDHVVTGLQSAGDIEDEPGVPAAMLTDRSAVDPYVGDGERPLELQLHPLPAPGRSEEHTSELQSRQYLVCRLLLEKKNESDVLERATNARLLLIREEDESLEA